MSRAEQVKSRLTGRGRTAPTTLVVLVRHGTTATTGRELPGRAPGLDLADTGRTQAQAAAARIAAMAGRNNGADAKDNDKNGKDAKTPPEPVLYASPLERAQQTAAPIADALGCAIQTEDDLTDLDIGEWTGMELKVAVKRKEWTAIQRHPSGFRFPGGESFMDMQARMVAAIERMRAQHPGQLVVAVSHADPIRSLVAHALGSHLDMFQRIMISPGSLTAIAFGDEGPAVLTVNSTHDGQALSPS
ncbi:MAG TPA: histidine phosphatase family protein [Acidimicrobiales bacterium]|jgi:probable phosphoglycerate mutase